MQMLSLRAGILMRSARRFPPAPFERCRGLRVGGVQRRQVALGSCVRESFRCSFGSRLRSLDSKHPCWLRFSKLASTMSRPEAEVQIPAHAWLHSARNVGLGLVAFISFDAASSMLMKTGGLDAFLPTPIGGMLGAFACLSAAAAMTPRPTAALHAMLMPGVGWVNRWMCVFMIPVQVMLPTIPLGFHEGLSLVCLCSGGWLASIIGTAWLVKLAEAFMPAATANVPVAAAAPPRITSRLPAAWLLLALLALPASIISDQIGDCFALPDASRMSGGVCLASLGVGSFAFGLHRGIPGHLCVLLCGGATMLGTAAVASLRGESYETVVRRDYLTSTKDGAGDWLLWFLSPALVATGAQMFQYRARVFRCGVLLIGCCTAVSLGNILGSVALGPYLGLSPEACIAATMRCVTMPMGLPTHARLCDAEGVDKNIALVALCGAISGFLGFMNSKSVLSSMLCSAPVTQPVTRGIATGATAHVLGSATFAASEQEAFVWGMLAMAATGVASASWICACPPVRELTLKLAHRGERWQQPS